MIDLRDIHSLTDFQRNAKKYVKKMSKTGCPLVLTVNGKPAVVVQDAEAYQALLDKLQQAEDLEAILEGMRDCEEGRVTPLEEAYVKLRKELGIQDRADAKSRKRPQASEKLDGRKLVADHRRRVV